MFVQRSCFIIITVAKTDRGALMLGTPLVVVVAAGVVVVTLGVESEEPVGEGSVVGEG